MNAIGKIGVVGLGYVGLPLAVSFARKYSVVGFDVSEARVTTLRQGIDYTNEISAEDLQRSNLTITDSVEDLRGCGILIVTVPTPVDDSCRPDFSHLKDACAVLGKVIEPGVIIVFESTVYPGATEEVCAPVIEAASGLKSGEGFKLGYSPERINPGDKAHPLEAIVKVVAGQDAETLDALADLYGSIIHAGIHRASSIRVAEAAKVIENTQRDLNIALMNELALIFNRLGIDTEEVLLAAGTKWNFLPFRPGLVGGHCIGVDPYYLTHKAQEVGYHPEIILAGRRLNDNMAAYVTSEILKLMANKRLRIKDSRVLVMGLAFKENCPDLRNSKVIDVIRELRDYNAQVDVYDPWIDRKEAQHEYGVKPLAALGKARYDAVIMAVGHKEFKEMGVKAVRKLLKPSGVLYDIKHIFRRDEVDGRL